MGEQDPLRRAVRYRLDRLVEEDRSTQPEATGRAPGPARATDPPGHTSGSGPAGDACSDPPGPASGCGPAGAAQVTDPPDAAPPTQGPRPRTMAARGAFADELVRQAIARGEFDDLPLMGKPIPGLTGRYDPDWWLKAFIEREQITGVLPEALQLRTDHALLDDRLDELHPESRVREAVEEFNARVVEARRQLLGGPPVVTPTREVEVEVARWRERRRARQRAAEAEAAAARTAEAGRPVRDRALRRRRARWWRGRGGDPDGAVP